MEVKGDRAVPWRSALGWLAAAGVAFAGTRLLARAWPGALDAYGSLVSYWVVRPLSLATGSVPFTVGEVASGVYLVVLAFMAAVGVARALREPRAAPALAHALARGTVRLVAHVSFLFLVFTLLWGFHYAQPGVEARQGWPTWDGVPLDELKILADESVAATNRAYVALHGVEDLGVPTPMDDWRGVEAALDEAWTAVGPAFLGSSGAGARRGAGKRPLLSPVLRRLGVSGMYFPFTAEGWITADVPAVSISNTLAHEKAHQRGVAGEADAGFLAAVAGVSAPHALARYSAAAYVQMQMMGAVARADREAWAALARQRVPGVQRDLDDLTAYWAAHRGPAREVRQVANDAYLRAHGVSAGIGDYGRTVNLLVAWSRLHPGWLLPQ